MRCLLLLAAVGCATAPPTVSFSDDWPSRSADYAAAHARWTRRAAKIADFTLVVDAAATLETPEWRAAYVRERARRLKLAPNFEAELAGAERAKAEDMWEVELVVATANRDWNNFHKGEVSMWRLTLAVDDGREVVAKSVKEDRRSRAELAEYFPDLEPFYKAYVVTFPKITADGRPLIAPGTRRVTMKIASAVATVELVWSSR